MTKKEISWATIDELVTVIAKKIHTDSPNIDSIYGIPRGGLIPAVLLSHKLGLPLVQKPKSNSLVVDDISDSGNTFIDFINTCLLYTSPSPRDRTRSRMPSSA